MADLQERSLTISGVKVIFPCKPYPSQFGMMDRVIKGLERGQNGLLESPTGSGKSLALLCSALAWQHAQHEKIIKEQLNPGNGTDHCGSCSCGDKEYSPDSKPKSRKSSGRGDRNSPVELSDDESDEDFKPASKGGARKHIKIAYEEDQPDKADINSGEKSKCTCSEGNASTEKKQKVPKIYYGTRTHKQIAQIARELKKTAYHDVRMAILASREYTCIHPQVVKLKNKSEGCRERLDARGPGCKFNEKSKRVYLNQSQIQEDLPTAWDLEDLVGACKDKKACPYFVTRNIIGSADIIFCPYNYLVDPLVRNSMEIDLKNQIVILDEAHNIEDSAREAGSGSLTTDQITQAIHNLQELLDHNIKFVEHLKLKRMLENVLQFIEDNSSSLAQKDYDQAYKVWSGFDIVVRLKSIDLGPENFASYKSCLEKALENDEKEVEMRNRQNQELKLSSPTIKTLEQLFQVLDYMYRNDLKFVEDYRVAILKSRTFMSNLETNGMWINSRNRNRAARMMEIHTLNFWCMNPAVAFSDFTPARNVILSSGTLSPMSSFASELGVPFPIQLEANHVIQDKQVWVGAIGQGPSGSILQAVYKNMETWGFQDELGHLIHKVCMTVPHGVLCFLPSYRALEKFTERWKVTGLWRKIAQRKRIMVEPRASDKEIFDGMMKAFYCVVNGETSCDMSDDDEDECYDDSGIDGALFFAVCRGKISEGMDFADNNARAVITVGIPYPSIKDLQVKLKREYNDRYKIERGLLSGSEWYEIQAFRALNQALGRCLRHRKDWGALIIVDDRFVRNKEKYCKSLSKWVRSKVQTFENFTHTLDSLSMFTEQMIQEMPVINADTSFIPSTPGASRRESLYIGLDDSTCISNSQMVGSQGNSSYFSPPENPPKMIFQTPQSSKKTVKSTPSKGGKSDVSPKGVNSSAIQSPVTPGNQQFQQIMGIVNSAAAPKDRPYYIILNQGLPDEQTFLIEPPGKGSSSDKATSSSSPAQPPKDLPVIAVPSTQKVIAPMASKLAAKLATSTGSATPNAKTVILPDTNSRVNPVSIQNNTPAQGQVSVPVNTETKSSTQTLNQVNMVAPSPKTNIVPVANTQTQSTHFVLQNQKLIPLVTSQTMVTKPQGLLLVGNNTVPGSGQIFLTQPHGVVPVANMASQDLSGQRKMTSLLGSTAAQLKQETVTHTAPGPQNIPQPVDTVVSGQTDCVHTATKTKEKGNPNDKFLKFVNLPASSSSKVATVAPMRPQTSVPITESNTATNQLGDNKIKIDGIEGSLAEIDAKDSIQGGCIMPRNAVVANVKSENYGKEVSSEETYVEKGKSAKTTVEAIEGSNVRKRPLFKTRKSLPVPNNSDVDEKKSLTEGEMIQDSDEDFRTDVKQTKKEIKAEKSDVDLVKDEVKNVRRSKTETEVNMGKTFNATGMTTRRKTKHPSFDVFTCITDSVKAMPAIIDNDKTELIDTEVKKTSTRGETKKSVADKLKHFRRESAGDVLQEIKPEEDNDFVEKVRSPLASPEEVLNTRRRRSGRKRKSSPSKLNSKRSKGVDFVDEVEDEKENEAAEVRCFKCAKCGVVLTQASEFEKRRRSPSFLKKLWPQNAEVIFFPSCEKLEGLQAISVIMQGGVDLNCYYDSVIGCCVEYLACRDCKKNNIIGARILQCNTSTEFQQYQMWLLYSAIKQ